MRNKISRGLLRRTKEYNIQEEDCPEKSKRQAVCRRSNSGVTLGCSGKGTWTACTPLPSGFVTRGHQTPHLPDPAGSAARGWVALRGSHASWPSLAAHHLHISGGSRPPLVHPPCLALNEWAQGVKAGRWAGGTALSSHLRPQPLFLDDQVRRTPDGC